MTGHRDVAVARLVMDWTADLKGREKELSDFPGILDAWDDFIMWLNARIHKEVKRAAEKNGSPDVMFALYSSLLSHTMPRFDAFVPMFDEIERREKKHISHIDVVKEGDKHSEEVGENGQDGE